MRPIYVLEITTKKTENYAVLCWMKEVFIIFTKNTFLQYDESLSFLKK